MQLLIKIFSAVISNLISLFQFSIVIKLYKTTVSAFLGNFYCIRIFITIYYTKKYYHLYVSCVTIPAWISQIFHMVFRSPMNSFQDPRSFPFSLSPITLFSIIARRLFKTYCYTRENLSYAENKQLHRMSVQCDEQRLERREVLDEYRHYQSCSLLKVNINDSCFMFQVKIIQNTLLQGK